MTWLVLGANGQLGQELINLLKTKNIDAIGTDRNEIDFTCLLYTSDAADE